MKKHWKSAVCVGVVIAANLAFVLLFGRIVHGISAGNLSALLPHSKAAALAALLGLYALKALSVFFPILVLQMTAGLIFGPVGGILVNTTGMAIGVILPYLLGRFAGADLQKTLCRKQSYVEKIERYRCNNETMFAYLLRAVGVVPCDMASFYLGSTGIRFLPYFGGSMLGTFTGIVISTLFGDTLRQGFSVGVIALWAVLLGVSYVITGAVNRRVRPKS